jgi:hypothetical protein
MCARSNRALVLWSFGPLVLWSFGPLVLWSFDGEHSAMCNQEGSDYVMGGLARSYYL